MGIFASICRGWRGTGGHRERAGGFATPRRGARKQHEDGRAIMELLLILIYVSICYVTFKVFKIPVNQWSLATAALGGIIGIALLLLIMNYNHPFTKNARIYFAVTPVFPSVRGRVIEVPVQTNVPLKEGDVLFRVDPKPYQYVVDQKKAMLAEAEQNVMQLKASLDQATAGTEIQRAIRSGAAELRPPSRVVPKAGHRAGDARYLYPQPRNRATVVDGGKSRGGAGAACVFVEYRRRQHHGRSPAFRIGRCPMGSRSDGDAGAGGRIRHPSRPAPGNVRRPRRFPVGHGVRQHRLAGPGVLRGLPAKFPAASQGR